MLARAHRLCALLGLVLAAGACSEHEPIEPEPLRLAVVLPLHDREELPNIEWAIENINTAGGVAGRSLAVDYFDVPPEELLELATELANDDEHVAVIGPAGSQGLMDVADIFVTAGKPIVSTTSTSDDLLRAYGGEGTIWRTRESDIAQVELLVRLARDGGAQKIALLTSLEPSTYTFFAWTGFFARELGYAEGALEIISVDPTQDCLAGVEQSLASGPDMLVVAASRPEQLECIVSSLPPPEQRPRVMLADTGLDPNALVQLGDAAHGIEGLSAAGDVAFEDAFRARFPEAILAPHGPSEYDAVLLIAYALEVSGGIGGTALLDAMKMVVDGTQPSVGNWDADGIAATLAELRSGGTPALEGATGPLRFEPDLYMDLAASTLAQFEIGPEGLVFGVRHSTGDPSFLTSEGAFVHPQSAPSLADSSWTPAQAKTDAWALVAALSSGWDNYRHQADALRQYWMLRSGGLDDDHIILILADDLHDHPFNALPGQVRNVPDGEDLYAGAEIDYRLDTLSLDDIDRILAGEVGETTPVVLSPTAGSNLYIYLAGHGGAEGIPLGAQTTGEGLAGGEQTLAPEQLRARLCDLRAQERARRVLVVIEACYSGVFGQASTGGLEWGCGFDPGTQPLEGVALLTAASAVEVSYAGAYDNDVPAWVNDAFSNQLALEIDLGLDRSLADVYTDAYRSTAGSHPGVFNAAHAGPLTGIAIGEFFTP